MKTNQATQISLDFSQTAQLPRRGNPLHAHAQKKRETGPSFEEYLQKAFGGEVVQEGEHIAPDLPPKQKLVLAKFPPLI